MMDLGLEGRHVLVAGASRGLGFAIVSALLGEGATVTAVARDPKALATAHLRWVKISPESKVRLVDLDLSIPDSAQQLRVLLEDTGKLHGLISVAGSGRPTNGRLTRAMSESISSNVMPSLVSLEAAGPILLESQDSAVVLVSSIAGMEYISCPPEYAAAKATLHAYGTHWSRSLAPVRVNVLAPGNIMTEDSVWERRFLEDPVQLDEYLKANCVALARVAAPFEIAKVAVFMVSPAASFMTGSTVVVDGGQARQW